MGLNQEYIEKMYRATGCLPETAKTETPADITSKLQKSQRDLEHALYYWARLWLAYGDQYRPTVQEVVLEIQGVQDKLTGLEKAEVAR